MSTTGSERWAWLRRGHWEPYVWLVYSVPFLVYAFHARHAWWQTTLMVASYPAFLAMYIGGQRVRGRRVLWLVVGLDALGVAFSGMNPGAESFFIYGSAMLGYVRPVRVAVGGLGVQVLVGVLAAYVLDKDGWYWVVTTMLAVLIGAVTIQGGVNEERDGSLRLAHDEIRRLAEVAERERIARDLHDVLGHTLSVIVLKSELAGKLVSRDPTRAHDEMADVERIARAGLAEVRQAITGYRAAGLRAEVAHALRLLRDAGVEAVVDVQPVALDAAQDTAMALGLREATTNVIRHAAAATCRISVHADPGSVQMVVHDNGRGGDAPFGNGLTGMRERIEALGGRVVRDTSDGTRLTITLPVASAPSEGAATAAPSAH